MFLRARATTRYGAVELFQGKLTPEEKVNLAIGMTDVCTCVCADAVRNRNRGLKEDEVIERVRERITYRKRLLSGT